MPKKEITRDEVLELRASAQVLMEQADKLLAKMDDQQRVQSTSNYTDVERARIRARRMKNFLK